ncbi:MAG TPA: DUF5801 repeats-in-toxin domain-containing protein, partial [Terriglobales bacterium]|nr:DUF5801 repeats-in-toxin domain-containing protein [Terriglobales bacterium]
GVINPTELQYKLIQPDENILVVGEAPSYSITFDITNGVVNEDDLHHVRYTHNGETSGEQVEVFFSGSDNPASAGLQDQLNSFFGDYSFKSRTGNDPFDTNDNENGSQNTPPLSDNNGGIDQDREPLSATAHVAVNFHNGPGGTLTFDHNGVTPVINALVAQNLTSHGNALSYELLPATATHGESIVAYYTDCGQTVVVFSLEIQEPNGAAQSTFDITYTIYGPIDNTGANAVEFDLPTEFFLNASGSAVFTASNPNDLVFRDIDDVPALGHFDYGCIDTGGETSGEGSTHAYGPVQYDPANLTIGIDETPGVQGPSHGNATGYNADLSVLDPHGTYQQQESQSTDDVCMTQWQANHYLQHAADTANSNPSSDATDNINSVLSNINSSYFINPSDPSCGFNVFLGAAQTCLDVSFGADGKAEGSVDGTKDAIAGQTLFDKDGNAAATAFQLYMQDGKTATGAPDGSAANTPVDSHLTNVWIDIDNGNGTFTREQVTAYQLDANTIIGIAFPSKTDEGGGDDTPRLTVADVEQGGNGTPVFMLHLDPQTGELTLVQYHSVENLDGCDPNDPTHILTDDGQQLIHFRATDYDGDYVDAPLEVSVIDDAPVICKVSYDCGNNEVDEDWLSSSTNNGVPGNHDKDTSPDNHDSPYGTDGNNNGDGPGHTHVTGQIDVQNEVDTPLIFSFKVAGLHNDGDHVDCFTDASGNVVKSSDGHDVGLTLCKVGTEWVITGSYSDGDTTHNVFTVTLDSLSGNFCFDLLGALQHPDNGGGDITRYEDNLNLNFGAQVQDSDGDKASTTLQFVVDDDAPKIVCQPVIDCTISSDPNGREGGTCLSESTCSVTVDTNNKPGWVTITAFNDAGSTSGASVDNIHGVGFGVISTTDGGSGGRFDEVNYTGNNTGSESLVFDFGTHLVESATIELARFYSDENGTDETGHWAAYKDGVLVAQGDFVADSKSGQFGFAIPTVAGGFDKLVFTATNDAQFTHGDNSDYLVQQLNLNLLPCDKQTGHFTYTYGADGGVAPTGDATSEAGLGFQAHYTGGTLTSDGHAVTVTEAVVDGHIVITATDSVTNLVVFTLNVDPGTPDSTTGIATASYTYTQYGPLDNNPGGSDLPFQFVIRDQDGDAVSTDICVCLKDATPTTGESCADVYEKGLDQPGTSHDGTAKGDGSNATTGFLNFSYNGDGPGHITDVHSNNADGATITHANGIWTVTTDVYVLTVDDTTGYYTFTLKENLQHADTPDDGYTNADGTNPTVNIADIISNLGFGYTVSDADGSTANGNLTVKVHDDGPIVESICYTSFDPSSGNREQINLNPYNSGNVGIVDEDWLKSNTNDGFNGNKDADNSDTAGGQNANKDLDGYSYCTGSVNVNFGADGPGGIHLTLPNGLNVERSIDNAPLSFQITTVGNVETLVGYVNGNGQYDGINHPVFTLSLNTQTGDFTFTLYQALEHNNPNNENNDNAQDILMNFGVDVVDGDGDHASGTIAIKVDDDSPSKFTVDFRSNDSTVDEDALTTQNPNDEKVTFSFDFVNGGGVGADGPGKTTFALNTTGLKTVEGDDVHTAMVNGQLIGYTGNDPSQHHVFVISNNGDGTYTFELDHALKHSGQQDSQITLNLTATITDADGDQQSSAFSIKVNDDTPGTPTIVSTDPNFKGGEGRVDEDFLTAATNGVAGNQDTDTTPDNNDSLGGANRGDGPGGASVGGSVVANYGADGPAASNAIKLTSWSVTNDNGNNQALKTSDGHQVDVTVSNTLIIGKDHTDGSTVFTLTLDQNSNTWVFTLLQALQHPYHDQDDKNNGPELSFEDNLHFSFGVTLTDGDGDTATGFIKINVDDDTPTATNFNLANVITENTGKQDLGTIDQVFGGHYSSGADGLGGITIVTNGSSTIGTLTIGADGHVYYTPPVNVNQDSNFNFTYQVTDGDGDAAQGVITVGVKNSDPAEGTLHSTNVTVAEDSQPHQNVADFTVVKGAVDLSSVFTPHDNEVLNSITINNIPTGVIISDGINTVVGNGSNSITILAANLGSVTLQEPADDKDNDYTLNFTASITDPDSSNTANISGGVINVTVDAVADKPTGVTVDAYGSGGTGDNTFSAGEHGHVHLTATFGDSSDGSEVHQVTLTLPAGFTIDGALPAGAVQNGQDITWTVTGSSFDQTINVQAPASFSGSP